MSLIEKELYLFGPFSLDPTERLILREGKPLSLTPKVFDTLVYLVRNHGRLLTKDELLKEVWPDAFVEEVNLAVNVSTLRKLLGEGPQEGRYIATVSGRGYRFVAPVEKVSKEQPNEYGREPDYRPGPLAAASSSTDLATPEDGFEERDLRKASSPKPAVASTIRSALEHNIESGKSKGASVTPSEPVPLTKRFPAAAILIGSGALALFAATVYWLRTPPPPPRVLATKQLTNDSRYKDRLVTDGSRIYFTEFFEGRWALSQVSTNGGEVGIIPTPFPNAQPYDAAAGRSELLATSWGVADLAMTSDPHTPLWTIPVPAGSPHRSGDILANDAAWSADEQSLVFSDGGALYIAKADGSSAKRIATVDGLVSFPKFSRDGSHVRFTVFTPENSTTSLWEVASDGTNLHPLFPDWHEDPGEAYGRWTPDQQYFVFDAVREGKSQIWATRQRTGFFSKASKTPVQLTTGPLDYYSPEPSRDGRRLFVIGAIPRAELQRYDLHSQQFVSFLSGISAGQLDFSPDGQWIAYVSYPENTLWKCRADCSEKVQLTFAPMQASMPRWSPDGKQIAFQGAPLGKSLKAHVVSSDGGSPQELRPDDSSTEDDVNWAPDGQSVVLMRGPVVGATDNPDSFSIIRFDVKARRSAPLPDSKGLFAPRWSPDGRYISAYTTDQKKILLFTVADSKWSELASGVNLQYPNWSKDGKWIYYESTGDKGPELHRVEVATRHTESLVNIKNISRVNLPFGSLWSGLTPDGSPLIMRDVSSREIYSLELQLP